MKVKRIAIIAQQLLAFITTKKDPKEMNEIFKNG